MTGGLVLRSSRASAPREARAHLNGISIALLGVPRSSPPRLRPTLDVVPPTYGAPVDPQRLLRRLARGFVHNVAFEDVRRLVEALGFELRRVTGSHHIFIHPEVPELLNLQDVRGQAKPYQIRQLLRIVERYALSLEDRP